MLLSVWYLNAFLQHRGMLLVRTTDGPVGCDHLLNQDNQSATIDRIPVWGLGGLVNHLNVFVMQELLTCQP